MLKKLLSLFLISLITATSSYADISNSSVSAFLFDSAGNSISSTGGSLNVLTTGTTTITGTITANQGTSPWVDNISQFGGSNVVTGTGASGSGIPRVTVANDSNILATQSGAWTTGRTWTLLNSTDSVNAVQSGTWTVQQGTPPWSVSQSGTWNINNISGTITLPTGAATSANQTNGSEKTQIVDGSGVVVGPVQTISGTNYAPVVLAASATPGAALVARSIQIAGSDGVNAQTISTNSSGQININNISGTVSLPTGAATSSNQTNGNQKNQIVDGSGNVIASTSNALNTFITNAGQQLAAASFPVVTQSNTAPATQNVTTQDLVSSSASGANSQSFITGTPTAGSAASFSIASFESVEVQVTGTWTGTLQSEISMDGGTTWFTRGLKQSGVAYVASSFTGNFQGALNVSGMTNYRVRATAAMTGTATVRIVSTIHADSITVTNPLLLKDATTQSITNTIKAASTAAGASDTALVVAVSPNNTVGVTQSTSPWVNNITQIAGSSISTAATGVQKVGITGNAGAAMDAAGQNASSPANSLLIAGQFNTSPTTITTGNMSPLQLDSGGNLKVNVNAQSLGVVNVFENGHGVLSTFTQNYGSVNLTTGAFITIISSTSSTINLIDDFDSSGGVYYLAYAATCGALSNATNAIIINPGGGMKNFQIPSGNCVGFEALGANITSGNVYMTFYK